MGNDFFSVFFQNVEKNLSINANRGGKNKYTATGLRQAEILLFLNQIVFFHSNEQTFCKTKTEHKLTSFLFPFGILTGMKDHKRQIMYGKRPEKTNGKKQ